MRIFRVTTSTGANFNFQLIKDRSFSKEMCADLTENCPIFRLVSFDPKFLAV